MNKTRPRIKPAKEKQGVVNWTIRNRFVLILASVLFALLSSAALLSTGGMNVAIMVALFAFLVLACGVLTITATRMLGLLNAIRRELMMIRVRSDTALLDDIATDLTAMRTQMSKGLLGLFGM